jgi:hypothetical protein
MSRQSDTPLNIVFRRHYIQSVVDAYDQTMRAFVPPSIVADSSKSSIRMNDQYNFQSTTINTDHIRTDRLLPNTTSRVVDVSVAEGYIALDADSKAPTPVVDYSHGPVYEYKLELPGGPAQDHAAEVKEDKVMNSVVDDVCKVSESEIKVGYDDLETKNDIFPQAPNHNPVIFPEAPQHEPPSYGNTSIYILKCIYYF